MIDKETHKELFVNTTNANVEIALQEDGKLVEFHREFSGNEFTVGNIYVGRVKNITWIKCGIYRYGHQKMLLHYLDLGVKVKTINKFVKTAYKITLTIYQLNQSKKKNTLLKRQYKRCFNC